LIMVWLVCSHSLSVGTSTLGLDSVC